MPVKLATIDCWFTPVRRKLMVPIFESNNNNNNNNNIKRWAERDDGLAPFSRLAVSDSWEIKQELEH